MDSDEACNNGSCATCFDPPVEEDYEDYTGNE
jgi:hypothetical protein